MEFDKIISDNCAELGISVEDAGKQIDVKQFPPTIRKKVRTVYYCDGYGDYRVQSGMRMDDFLESIKEIIESIPENQRENATLSFGNDYDGCTWFEFVSSRDETDEEMRLRRNKEIQAVINFNNQVKRT